MHIYKGIHCSERPTTMIVFTYSTVEKKILQQEIIIWINSQYNSPLYPGIVTIRIELLESIGQSVYI